MFDSLALEDQRNDARRWTTMVSFAMETVFVATLIMLPLVYTEVLPSLRIGDAVVAPVYSVPAQEVTEMAPTSAARETNVSEFVDSHLVAPDRIPDKIKYVVDKTDPVAPVGDGVFIPGAIPGSGGNTESMRSLLNSLKPDNVVRSADPPVRERVRVSTLDPGLLIQRIQPIYPRLAIAAHIEGTVILAAVINTQGRITQLRAVSGHPMLVPAAIDAVRQWRYRPYVLNGAPTEVETQVSVVFAFR